MSVERPIQENVGKVQMSATIVGSKDITPGIATKGKTKHEELTP